MHTFHEHVQRYQKRIRKPLMDRIDIHLDVPWIPYQKLKTADTDESFKVIRARATAARQDQAEHFAPRLSVWEITACSGSFGRGSVGNETYREAPLEHKKKKNFLGEV